jgi:hypothetical protein
LIPWEILCRWLIFILPDIHDKNKRNFKFTIVSECYSLYHWTKGNTHQQKHRFVILCSIKIELVSRYSIKWRITLVTNCILNAARCHLIYPAGYWIKPVRMYKFKKHTIDLQSRTSLDRKVYKKNCLFKQVVTSHWNSITSRHVQKK